MHESMYDYYMTEIQGLWPVSFAMQTGGWHIDVPALLRMRKKVAEGINIHQDRLKEIVGWLPNTKSYIDMGRLLEQYQVPITRTAKGRPKISKEALLSYGARYPSVRPALAESVEITKLRTLASNFLEMALNRDDYYFPSYRLNGTSSGRFASEGADEGGPQGQNIPSELRQIVIADDPSLDELTSADLKQAEGLIVSYDSQDTFWIRAFEAGKDLHRVGALIIYHGWDTTKGLPSDQLINSIEKVCPRCKADEAIECTHSERFIAKSSRYAFQYGEGARKFVTKQLPPSGVFISEAEGKRIRSKIISQALARWQREADEQLKTTRWFTNALGRKREFFGLHADDGKMLRALLSWKAQSVVNVILGRAMRRFAADAAKLSPSPRIVTTTYDSMLINHRKEYRSQVYEMLHAAFDQPIPLRGRTLNIPLDVNSGPNWRDAK